MVSSAPVTLHLILHTQTHTHTQTNEWAAQPPLSNAPFCRDMSCKRVIVSEWNEYGSSGGDGNMRPARLSSKLAARTEHFRRTQELVKCS